jgi:alkanesulfonate monooxygenase SsuD/methylene tetrahydromethanopterin reductase-like flavin-dependent oxidoreductase (luciferase family)
MPQHAGVGLEFYAEALADIRQMAQAHGRNGEEIVPGILYSTAIDEDRQRAGEKAAILRRRADFAQFSVEELRDRGVVLWGNPDDCARSLEKYIRAGVRYFTLSFVPFADADGAMRAMELYATKVLPRVSPA